MDIWRYVEELAKLDLTQRRLGVLFWALRQAVGIALMIGVAVAVWIAAVHGHLPAHVPLI
jgi:hypothetical protein